MNWTIIIIVVILAICLVVFIIIQNLKDKKNFEEKMNNDYPRTYDLNGEMDDDN